MNRRRLLGLVVGLMMLGAISGLPFFLNFPLGTLGAAVADNATDALDGLILAGFGLLVVAGLVGLVPLGSGVLGIVGMVLLSFGPGSLGVDLSPVGPGFYLLWLLSIAQLGISYWLSKNGKPKVPAAPVAQQVGAPAPTYTAPPPTSPAPRAGQFCSSCGAANATEAYFCTECGAVLKR